MKNKNKAFWAKEKKKWLKNKNKFDEPIYKYQTDEDELFEQNKEIVNYLMQRRKIGR